MGKNYNGTQISQSVTVSEVAGATVEAVSYTHLHRMFGQRATLMPIVG